MVRRSAFGTLVAFVEQFIDQATGRLPAMLAYRPPHRGQQTKLGVDGVEIAHASKRKCRAVARKSLRCCREIQRENLVRYTAHLRGRTGRR